MKKKKKHKSSAVASVISVISANRDAGQDEEEGTKSSLSSPASSSTAKLTIRMDAGQEQQHPISFVKAGTCHHLCRPSAHPLILILFVLILVISLQPSHGNDMSPPSLPKNGTTRSPFHPTFAPYPATPVPQQPKRISSSGGPSLGSRFLSFLRSVRGTLEDVVSDVDPGVDRVFYMEKNETDAPRPDRMAEIILRKSSILTGGESRIIACRIYADTKTVTEKISKLKTEDKKKMITGEEMVNLIMNCNDIDKMKPYMIPTLKTEQQLLQPSAKGRDDNDDSDDNSVNNSTSRKSPPPGGEDEKNGVFDGVAIYPGTKWCGAGDIATNDDDLGSEKEADACCRQHDKCPDNIPSGEMKYNLTNKDHYTKSACECDSKFYQCLKDAKTFVGDQIGRLYFNVIQIQCFRQDYPVIKCTDKKGFLMNRLRKSCQQYEFDTTKEKLTQFFDPPFYDGQAGPLFNIPVVSNILEKPVTSFKESTINGGVIGNVVAG